MRKGLALLAICLAGIAGAVTFEWTDANKVGSVFTGGNPSANPLSALQQSKTNTTTLFGAIVTGGYPAGNRVIFGVGNGTDTTSSLSVTIGSNGELSLWKGGSGNSGNGSTQGQQVGSTTATGTFPKATETKLVLQLARTESSLTASLFVDGTDTALVSGTVDFGTTTLDTLYVGNWYKSGGAMYGAATSVQAYALPEPGVLGLLALGVAGLALRRKVA